MNTIQEINFNPNNQLNASSFKNLYSQEVQSSWNTAKIISSIQVYESKSLKILSIIF